MSSSISLGYSPSNGATGAKAQLPFYVTAYGADPAHDSATNGAAIQACLDAAGAYGRVQFEAGSYACDRTLTYYEGQHWQGVSGSQKVTGQTRVTFDNAVTVGIEPHDTTVDTNNVVIEGIAFIGGTSTSPVINWYRTSYGRLRDVYVEGAASGGVGVLLDANVSNQCYFNVFDQVKSLGHVGIRFQNGANANTILGGRFGSGSDMGIEFLSLSTANLVLGADFESFNTSAIHVDAPENRIVACHFEVAPIGIDITANGARTYHAGNTMATSVTTPVQNAGTAQDVGHEVFNATSGVQVRWAASLLRMASDWFTTSTPWDFDALPFSGTANSLFRFFKNTTTTGSRLLQLFKGDGTSTVTITLDAATGTVTGLTVTGKGVTMSDAAGFARNLFWQTNGVARWNLQCDQTAETGSNAGSNLNLLARSDTGTSVATVFTVTRSTGAIEFKTQLAHSGTKLGFYSATPVVRPAALTQTYSTADRTLSAYTADDESTAYTGQDNAQAGSVYAKLDDVNALRTAYENLRAFVEDLAQHHNAVVDDLQSMGLEQ